MRQFYFEKMRVWNNARKLVNEIYSLSKAFPKSEEFHLFSQIRRSACSVRSNIAEGQGRDTSKEQIRFTNIAYSSAIETLDHLITALDQHYVEYEDYVQCREMVELICNQLNALKKTLKEKESTKTKISRVD